MTKAFDLLGRSVLLDKLLAMDFAGCFQVDCFLPVWSRYDLLNLRHVDNDNINLCTYRSRMSPPTNVSVLQGSNLGPILFNLFCMWMTYLIPWKVWLFADDVCHQILIMLTEMLWWIIHNLAWTKYFGMAWVNLFGVGTVKKQIIGLHNRKLLDSEPQLSLNDSPLQTCG